MENHMNAAPSVTSAVEALNLRYLLDYPGEAARQLERMRVDVIEAGFPAASNGDFESVRAVAQTIKDSIVCGLARASDTDIRRAGDLDRLH